MNTRMTAAEILPNPDIVRLRDFFPSAARDIVITRPSKLFMPDEWTKAFAQGLSRLAEKDAAFKAGSILEVGVGTGINMAGIVSITHPSATYTGIDISDLAVTASTLLAAHHNWDVTLFQSDLLNDVEDERLSSVDHIVACIPQVPAKVDLMESDNAAHYYNPTGTDWDKFGLGLNAALLEQASARAPQASVTLNLAGRPGLGRLTSLFNQHGYCPDILHSTMVAQHADTSLSPLAALENAGCAPFEFYADCNGTKQLSAIEAEARRLDRKPLYHKLYVLNAPAIDL